MNHNNSSNKNEVLLTVCPLDILFKIRLGLSNPKNIIARYDSHTNKVLGRYNLFSTSRLNHKIENIINATEVKPRSVIDISIMGGKKCFDMDYINDRLTACAHTNGYGNVEYIMDSSHDTTNDVQFKDCMLSHATTNDTYLNDCILYKLEVMNVGHSTRFNMVTSLGNLIRRVDSITIRFELDEQDSDFTPYSTRMCFKTHCGDDIVYVGSKVWTNNIGKGSTYVHKTFALGYNSTFSFRKPVRTGGSIEPDVTFRGSCFKYVILDPDISVVSSDYIVANVFRFCNSKTVLCITNEKNSSELSLTGDRTWCCKKNIYVYDINTRGLLAKIAINTFPTVRPEIIFKVTFCTVSLALIGKRLVRVEHDKSLNLINFTWINSDDWRIEESINFIITNPDIVDIKLIGLNDFLSSLVIIKRNIVRLIDKYSFNNSAEIYYF